MKTHLLTIFILILSLSSSCSKEEIGTIHISIDVQEDQSSQNTETKLTGNNYNNTTLCSTIRSLDILVFDANDQLEKHKRISDAWNRETILPVNTSITDRYFSINVNEGVKTILVIANSQHSKEELYNYYKGNTETCESTIEMEYPGVYTMYGIATINVSGSANVAIQLNKIVSRIVVNSIKASINSISFCEVQLKNVIGNATITKSGLIVNTKQRWNMNSFSSQGMTLGDNMASNQPFALDNHLYYEILSIAKNATFSTPIYLYCYPNMTNKKTLLIISGQIVYQPSSFPIAFTKIESNTSYEIECINITTSGSGPSSTTPIYTIEASTLTKSPNNDSGWNICAIGNINL